MGKKSRPKQAQPKAAPSSSGTGPRQPCPCGSGRRYKACHGSADGTAPSVIRTFEGLPGECDWVALREFVPAGVAPLTLMAGAFDGAADGRTVKVVSVLPGIAPALARDDGEVWVATQVAHKSSDPSRDFAAALRLGLTLEAGESATMTELPNDGPRLQDVVDPDAPLDVTVLDGFDFWFEGAADSDGSIASTLENLNASIDPTSRLESIDAGYWTSVGSKEHLRWVLPHDEEKALTALARLHAAGADLLTPDSRLVGSFRAHGLLVPVWDLPVGTGAEGLEELAAALASRLGEALSTTTPLSDRERSARQGLATRQVTIR
jgi:hypothetical protein